MASPTTELTAEAIVTGVAALPGARRIAAPSPILQSVVVAGVELAAGPASASESSLRRVWRERHGTGAQPLLLLADDRERPGCLRVLGAVDGTGPLRTVDAEALRNVLRRISTYQRLDAVRELAAELERLDQAGIPGLKVRGLLTTHTLDVRLRRDAVRWTAAKDAVAAIGKSATWQHVLAALGYELDRRRVRGYVVRRGSRTSVRPKPSTAK